MLSRLSSHLFSVSLIRSTYVYVTDGWNMCCYAELQQAILHLLYWNCTRSSPLQAKTRVPPTQSQQSRETKQATALKLDVYVHLRAHRLSFVLKT